MPRIYFILFLFIGVGLTACNSKNIASDESYVMVTSVSSDGKFAITTNKNKRAYLWDLSQKRYQQLPYKNVNIYSAYFIKGADEFVIQLNKNNKVLVINTKGEVIKTFRPSIPSYGEIVTNDLSTWIGADNFFQLYKIHNNKEEQFFYYWSGPNYKDEPVPPKGKPYGASSFMGSSKLFSLNILRDESAFVATDGAGDFYLWSIPDGKLEKKLEKTIGQTVNAISPDGKYAVVADQQRGAFLYDLNKGSIISNKYGLKFAINTPVLPSAENYFYDIYPSGTKRLNRNDPDELTALKFIDNERYIASFSDSPYTFNYLGLYKAKDIRKIVVSGLTSAQAKPIKYLPLMDKKNQTEEAPYPETKSFVRDQAMDTSPSAHVLVMGQANGGGIMVYHYDPDTQTLKLVWAPKLKPEPKAWYQKLFNVFK